MAKQKNRKKSLKNQLNKESKVIDFKQAQPFSSHRSIHEEEEISLFDDLDEVDFDWEVEDSPELFQQMLAKAKRMLPPQAYKDLMTDLMRQVPDGELDFLKVMAEKNETKRLEKLAALTQQFPNNFNILFEFLIHQNGMLEVDYLQAIGRLENLTLKEWADLDYGGTEVEACLTYLEACHFLINYYLLSGFYRRALSLADFVESKVGENVLEDFEYLRYATYTALYRLEELEARQAASSKPNEVLLLNLTFSYLLNADLPAAQKTFQALVAIHPDAPKWFGWPNWQERVQAFDSMVIDLDVQSPLIQAMLPLMEFLLNKFFLVEQMVALATPYLKPSDNLSVMMDWEKNRDFIEALELMCLPNAPEFNDIRRDIVMTLAYAGYRSAGDFKKVTEKDLLKLSGVGVGTVAKLKRNGVVFKPEKKKKGKDD